MIYSFCLGVIVGICLYHWWTVTYDKPLPLLRMRNRNGQHTYAP